MKILLAVDGSKSSDAAIRTVVSQVRPQDAEILIVTIVEVRGPELGATPKDFFTRAQDSAKSAAETLHAAGFKVDTRVFEEEARIGILNTAAEWRPDLIVLGSHGHSELRRFLLGSVAESVARHADCSVLIVRMPVKPGTHSIAS
jgi:nucleotide-binding universal stress UspA family protein